MILSQRVIGGVSWPGLLVIVILSLVALPAWSLGQADPPEAPKPAPTAETPAAVVEKPGEERPLEGADPSKARAADPTTIRMPAGSKCEISRLNRKIARVTDEDPTIVSAKSISDHQVQLEAKQVGIAHLHFYDENDKLELIRVEVVEASGEPATVVLDQSPKEANDGTPQQQESRKPGHVQLSLDPPVQQAIEFLNAANESERSAERQADSASATSSTSGRYSDQINITDLGIALIEARGEALLTEIQMSSYATANSKAKGTVSQDELRSSEIKHHTAKEKLALLMRIGKSAYDSANAELKFQQTAVERLAKLKDAQKISTAQFEQGEAELRAAQAKVKLIEIALPDLNKKR